MQTKTWMFLGRNSRRERVDEGFSDYCESILVVLEDSTSGFTWRLVKSRIEVVMDDREGTYINDASSKLKV